MNAGVNYSPEGLRDVVKHTQVVRSGERTWIWPSHSRSPSATGGCGRSQWDEMRFSWLLGHPLNQLRKHNWDHTDEGSCKRAQLWPRKRIEQKKQRAQSSGVQDLVVWATESPQVTSVQFCHKQNGVEMAHGEKDKTKHTTVTVATTDWVLTKNPFQSHSTKCLPGFISPNLHVSPLK